MKTVILCGGSGTRLWPISRTRTPKQFAKIFNGQSLYEKTIQRNQSLSESFCVVVNDKQLPSCHGQTSGDINVNFLIEPVGRNTAAAIALAALASNPDEILLVLPSDHLIKDLENYNQSIEQAKAFAKDNKLVTFGIEAKYPETGYGYIEAQGSEVLSFKEKPDLETAKEYLKKGNYYWNSGMFCFKASTFLEELFCHSPDIFNAA
jgi:mannose-1-phosphate guanylyltransferase